jgi:GT2 family glycosyltransferase
MRTPAPLRVLHVDLAGAPLAQHVKDSEAFDDPRDLYVVFWWRGLALGHAEIPLALWRSSSALSDLVARTVVPAVRGWLGPADDSLPEDSVLSRLETVCQPTTARSKQVSVVICTRNRPQALKRCLESVVRCTPQAGEVIVVDNAPATDVTRAVVARYPAITYVAEPVPGLSAARNSGVRKASGEIVAFTDDDVTVHPQWLGWLGQSFENPSVQAVTGLVLPAELETPAQVVFEQVQGGFGGGHRHKTFGPAFFAAGKAKGVPVWRIGAGASMAVRRSAFDAVGLFDVRLGAGAAGCSEDSELWYRLLAEGWTCAYNPAAVVLHYHRETTAELQRQQMAYVRGHLAALFAQFSRYRHWGNLRRALLALPRYYLRRAPAELLRLVHPGQAGRSDACLVVPSTYLAELRGYVEGLTLAPRLLAGSYSPSAGRQIKRSRHPHRTAGARPAGGGSD